MTLASNRYYKQDSSSGYEKEVSFFDVETWSKLAQACYERGKKGRGIRVVGRLKQSRWNDTDGKSRSRVSIVAEHVEFRPEFRKEGKTSSSSGVSFDDEFETDENDVEVMAMAMQEKELAEVTF
jgi:single-strand DNA-binding protein